MAVVTDRLVFVIELKMGETKFQAADKRQVEEYGLDLRDFHGPSRDVSILPVLWCPESASRFEYPIPKKSGVAEVHTVGRGGLATLIQNAYGAATSYPTVVKDSWESGAYKPVPSVIEAATSMFAGHGVKEIARADASNLDEAAVRIIEIIDEARRDQRHALIFLTGVPGSGKTLAGLQVVHGAVTEGVEDEGDIVYLSGNTPLVVVLREALTRDEYRRKKEAGHNPKKGEVRTSVRARIQHIIDFLKEYLFDAQERAPHEHAIIFDEAQRAWNEKFGKQKFNRTASEPRLLFEIMGRHEGWCALVGLVGGGQEINTGENGMTEWGDALRSLSSEAQAKWSVYGPESVLEGDETMDFRGLGDLPKSVPVVKDDRLRLSVPVRSYRSPLVADWVAAVIDGDEEAARGFASKIDEYPIFITRSLGTARTWLRDQGRGHRRYGLVASSNARRLRAEGLGVTLMATEKSKIAHWYLNDRSDIRSSFAMEVTANEYTAQGLELDFVGLCWGGDFVRLDDSWKTRQLRGNKWVRARGERRRFLKNSYRVLMTRAREGLIIWVPEGDKTDPTRKPKLLDETATFLVACGAVEYPDASGE